MRLALFFILPVVTGVASFAGVVVARRRFR